MAEQLRPLAVTIPHAAELVDCCENHFRVNVLPNLRTVQVGSVLRVPVAEIERWLEQQAVIRSGGKAPAGAGQSGSVSGDNAKSALPASKTGERKARLKKLREKSMRAQSVASNVRSLPSRSDRRTSSR